MTKRGDTCGYCQTPLSGKLLCPKCGKWNVPRVATSSIVEDGTRLLSEVKGDRVQRIATGRAWDKCFGGELHNDDVIGLGITIGSTILLGGVAGAGKSTAALQILDSISDITGRETMYVAAEESDEQIKDRASRLALRHPNRMRLYPMGCSFDLTQCLLTRRPSALVLDSLPGFATTPDEQVGLCKALKGMAVELKAPAILIDHINKQDDFAGLERLKHEVDTTITLFTTGEGEQRVMTTMKNRFGVANLPIHLLMTAHGLIDIASEEDEDEADDEVDD